MATLTIADIDGEDDLNAAFAIRREVFCGEQGVDEAEEIDGLDPDCRHYLAWLAGDAVGTARTRPLAGGIKIERVAVLKRLRGSGIGKALMIRALADITAGPAVLNAQLAVEGFYARLGFVSEGEIFQEAGIDHVRMVKRL
jgi:predicted GNAT family N-acyltransferase